MSPRGRALAWGFAVLGAWELLCRLVPPPDPAVPSGTPAAETITLEGDPYLLWQLRPGERLERGKKVSVNAQGFRGAALGPKSGLRILTLGDSSVYGFGVADDEVFSAGLRGAEVVNGATPGWSSFQTLNMLDIRGWATDPDLLIIGNLWSDNNFDDFVDKELLASYAGFADSPAYDARRVLSSSALFRWLDWQLRVEPTQARARQVGWTMGGDGPKSGKRRVALSDYAQNLDTLCARQRARDGGVLFLMLANREDVNPRSHDPAWGPYRDVMRQAADRHGVPLVAFPDTVRADGRGEDTLFMDEMHPTAAGHALLRAAVQRALDDAGWPERRLVPGLPPPLGPLTDRFEQRGNDPRAPHDNSRSPVGVSG